MENFKESSWTYLDSNELVRVVLVDIFKFFEVIFKGLQLGLLSAKLSS